MTFVGRHQERRRLEEILATRASAPFVVHVQGMPGIGKSALLEQVSSDAAHLGYIVHTVPRALGLMERAQELHRRLGHARGRTLIVVDDWHQMAIAEASLVEWIERATGPIAILVGSRLRPRPPFVDSALFPGRLFALELGGLSPEDGLELLAGRGCSPEHAREVHRACRGQPFAMLLLAMSPGLWESVGARRPPGPEVSDSVALALVQRLVGQITDPISRDAVTLAALAGSLNQRELRIAFELDPTSAEARFEQLRELTVVRTTATGLELHPIVRAAVLADLRLRDPVSARVLVDRALGPIEEALGWTGIPRDRALRQLRDLAAAAPQDVALSAMFELDDREQPRVSQARTRDLPDALDLVEAMEGPAARRIAQRYAAHDPAAVTVVHAGDRIDGVMIRVELRGPQVPASLAEPAVDRLVEVLGASGELVPGKLLRTTRFFLTRDHHQLPCMELGALGAAITRRTLETYEPFLSVQHLEPRAVEAWRGLVATMGFVVRHEAAAEVDGRTIVPCIADFADLGIVFSGVVRRSWGVGPAPAVRRPAALQIEAEVADIEDDVFQALRHLRDTVWLQTSALAAYLFPDAPLGARGERLRRWLEEAIADTETMRHGDLVSRALHASYGASQSAEEAASHAGMGLSTLKRYRRSGVLHVTALAHRLARSDP